MDAVCRLCGPGRGAGVMLAAAAAVTSHGASAQSATAQPASGQASTPRPGDVSATGTGAGGDVVVTATRSGDAVSTKLLGSSATVIDAEALADRDTRIVSDVLRDVPGVAVNRTGAVGALTQVRIRGAEGNQVLVLIDGVKASDPYYGEFDFGTLIADEGARVEVLRGQQSSLYGSDAIGGVINYITLNGSEAPGLRARAEGGSMGSYDGSARYAGVAGTLDYALAGSYFHTDGYPVARGGRRDVGSTQAGASAKLVWSPTATFRVTAVGRYSHTRADTDDTDYTTVRVGGVTRPGPDFGLAVDSPGVYHTNDAYYGLVRAELASLDGAWTNAVSAQIADTTRNGYEPYGFSYGDTGRRYRGFYESTVRFATGRVKHRLTLAVDGEREQFENTSPGAFVFTGKRHSDTVGLVGQYDLTLDDRLALGGSVRRDLNSLFSDDMTYRVQGSYLLPSGTRVHAVAGSGVKAPGFYELYGYADGQFIGNPDLKPERSEGWEAGVEQGLAGNRITAGATWFDNRFRDEIVTTYPPPTYVATPANLTTSSKQRGVEVYAQARFGPAVRVDASYTYLDAKQLRNVLLNGAFTVFDGQAVRRPRNIASLNVTVAPPRLPVQGTLTIRYNGRQNDLAFTDPSFTPAIAVLKDYTLVNLNVGYTVARHVELFVRAENLLDECYEEVFGYATPRRAVYGGIKARF